MAENSRGFRSSHNVSHHTVVMRRARDDDARRIAESDDGAVVHENPNNLSASLTARGTGTQHLRRTKSGRTTTASGRQVTVEQRDGVTRHITSTRMTGEQIDSIRLAGGDTIIKYKSGDMVIRRGTRRLRMRNQLIWGYALGYLVVFGLFIYHILTGTSMITPDAFVDKAFRKRHGEEVIDLTRAAVESMRGNRTTAEIRLAQPISFYDEEKEQIRIASGDRLTLHTAAKLGHAIIEDQKRSSADRLFKKPIKIYKETYLAGIDWPHMLTLYNAIGFFLLAALFLWRPIMNYLGTQSKKTAVALRNARNSRLDALESLQKYKDLDKELEERRDSVQGHIASRSLKEREQAVVDAKKEARDISGGAQAAIENERAKQFSSIGCEMADKACDKARAILEQRLGRVEHDAAIDQLIADIAAFGAGRAKELHAVGSDASGE